MSALTPLLASVWSEVTGCCASRFVLWTALALGLDALIGDPVFRYHPIRLLGRWLAFLEAQLFRMGWNGYGGGVLLFLLLAATVLPLVFGLLAAAAALHPLALHAMAGAVLWACLALRDLLAHGERIARAVQRGDLPAARTAVSMLVGRDTGCMDLRACGRGAVESLSENLVDGVLAPLVFALVLGPLGAVLYKIISTMDSMVGYKTERYRHFGWCGARLDDAANYLVARWSFLLLGALALVLPGLGGRKAWRVGWADHAHVPGPNSGWPEATMAGALGLRLIGPLYKDGVQVCDLWLGDPADPAGAGPGDIRRCHLLLILATLATFGLGWLVAR
ncbi:MAG: adenosylcobinamide-phosphate synthase CbiB [Verrucomicrobiota bacterium]|nr:adenosylcobinamide-phosphate synthase CbiB [Opitutales bacterium]